MSRSLWEQGVGGVYLATLSAEAPLNLQTWIRGDNRRCQWRVRGDLHQDNQRFSFMLSHSYCSDGINFMLRTQGGVRLVQARSAVRCKGAYHSA